MSRTLCLVLVALIGCADSDQPVHYAPTSLSADTTQAVVADERSHEAGTEVDFDESEDVTVGVPARLDNLPDTCGLLAGMHPVPGDEGQWAASVLTPEAYPFRVDAVTAVLHNRPTPQSSCDAGRAQLVAVWVTPTGVTKPPTDAAPDWSISFPAGEFTGDSRELHGVLPRGLMLHDGESLVVAVQLDGTRSDSSCLRACGSDVLPGTAFESALAEAPFVWMARTDTGKPVNHFLFAEGVELDAASPR